MTSRFSPKGKKLVGVAGFVACAIAATAVDLESLTGVVLLAIATGFVLVLVDAAHTEYGAKVAAAPAELRGIPRDRVARALLASWLLPGTGHLLLGWSRVRALFLAGLFAAVALAGITGRIPEWAAIALAALPWLAAQTELRYRTGWTSPLVPQLADAFPPQPDEPEAFARADRLGSDDPRGSWRGRS
jgi:hypothetical protein